MEKPKTREYEKISSPKNKNAVIISLTMSMLQYYFFGETQKEIFFHFLHTALSIQWQECHSIGVVNTHDEVTNSIAFNKQTGGK